MKIIMRYIYLALVLMAGISASAADDVKVTQRLDSAYLLMGKTTVMHLEASMTGRPTGHFFVDVSKFPENVEPTAGDVSISHVGNNRYTMRQDIKLQSFDSGMYTIPAAAYIAGHDTAFAKPLALKVVPVNVDSLKDIHPDPDVVNVKLHWTDRLPDWLVDYWLWILLSVIAVGLIVAWWKIYGPKKIKEVLAAKPEPKLPAFMVALQGLKKLQSEHLCEKGLEKEYYTRLTEILRVYMQERFGINAMEMTSSEIINALEALPADEAVSPGEMRQVLNMADFVKFAKVRPLPEDNIKVYDAAVRFVEDTRVMPKQEAEAADALPKNEKIKNHKE